MPPTNPGTPALTPTDQLMMMASGAWVTQMIHGAAELGVADQLAAGERDCEELAAACGAHPDALFRLLRGLASLGIFQETGPRRFGLTPLAELLRSDHPHSLRHFARLLGEEHYLGWADLDPFPGKLLDLNMLVMTEGGRERTPSPLSVVEAVAA